MTLIEVIDPLTRKAVPVEKGDLGGSSSGGITQSQVQAAIQAATNLDQIEALLATLNGYVDGLEALLTLTKGAGARDATTLRTTLATEDINAVVTPLNTIATNTANTRYNTMLAEDSSGTAFLVRFDYQSGTVSYLSLAGGGDSYAPTGNITVAPPDAGREIKSDVFEALTTSAGNWTAGDPISRIQFFNTATNVLVATIWINDRTGSTLGTAPTIGTDVQLNPDALLALVSQLTGLVNFTKGSGAIDSNTLRATLATDGVAVTSLSAITTNTTGLNNLSKNAGNTDTNTIRVVPASDAPAPIGLAYRSVATITRAANTTAYTANDVYGGAIQLSSVGPSGGFIIITSVDIVFNITSVPSGMSAFWLYLYDATPPSAVADNGAFSIPSSPNDRAAILTPGGISLGSAVLARGGGSVVLQADNLNLQFKLATSQTSLWAYLVTAGAFTPAANSETASIRVRSLGV